jgi:hypothetical protein
MPAGNISSVDRLKRMYEIKSLKEEGLGDQEIADRISLPITTVKRNIKYLEELKTSDLSPEQIAEKRGEIYLELVEASEKAKSLHDKYEQEPGKASVARGYFYVQLKAIELKMQLYGLQNVKPDLQVNTQNIFYTEPEKIDYSTGSKIAEILKSSHEKKLEATFKKEETNGD